MLTFLLITILNLRHLQAEDSKCVLERRVWRQFRKTLFLTQTDVFLSLLSMMIVLYLEH